MAEAANMIEIIGFPLHIEDCEEASLSPKQRYIEGLKKRHKNKRVMFGTKANLHTPTAPFAQARLSSKLERT